MQDVVDKISASLLSPEAQYFWCVKYLDQGKVQVHYNASAHAKPMVRIVVVFSATARPKGFPCWLIVNDVEVELTASEMIALCTAVQQFHADYRAVQNKRARDLVLQVELPGCQTIGETSMNNMTKNDRRDFDGQHD
jgi:hypothetical protein